MDDKSHKFAGELLEWIKSILRDLGIETGRVMKWKVLYIQF